MIRMIRRIPLIPLAALACARAEPAEHRPEGSVEPVPAARVQETGAMGLYRAAGSVRAARRAELSTRLMGRIETVRVRAGEMVRAGQVLLTIERGSLTAAERQAQSALDLATSNLRRVERLYADSAAPLVQLEAARAGHAQAEAQVKAVRADLAYADLRAPFAGIVTARLADPGDNAAPGQPLLVVEDRTAREIVVTVPEEVRAALHPGRVVPVEIGAGGRRVPGRVTAIVPGADPQSPTIEVRLSAPADLAPGVAAVAELPVSERRMLEVPASALVGRGQLDGVFLFQPDSTLRLRWIRLGRAHDDMVEVLSGLRAGDIVAVDGSKARDGMRARPLLEGAPD